MLGVALAAVILWLQPQLGAPPAAQDSPARRVPAGDPAALTASYAEPVERAAPAVVNIFTAKRVTERRLPPGLDAPLFRRFFGEAPTRQRTETSLGSGVIVDERGYILTNHHVIEGADRIRVLLADGRKTDAEVVGRDPATDLAVLRIRLDGLPVITFSPADEAVRVGDVVLAIGNPFGVGQTVTQGIISATGRDRLGLSTYENFLQTDAAINPGNSGGALVDSAGRLVGVNTAMFSGSGGSQGIGFAIPAGIARSVMGDLIEHGRVVRGWLGVRAQRLTPAVAEALGTERTSGVVLTGLLSGGPADQAGLRPGDVITRLGETAISDVQDLLRAAGQGAPGSELRVRGYRDGEAFARAVALGERPDPQRLRR